MITSKLRSKARTTIPQAVRMALRLREGDEIAYSIEGDAVVILKAATLAIIENPFATFAEWNSDADRRAYADL
jgi:antitoxin PrlF